MPKRLLAFLPALPALSALLALSALGHQTAAGTDIEASTTEAAEPWTSLAANDAPEDFHFVIVSDRTGGARPGVFASAIPKVNLLEPAFVVSVGDLIEGYTEDQAQLDREWDEFEGFIANLEVPFFYAAGNHDMNNAVMAETWRARFGPSYYRFVYKDVLFLVLNSELFGMVGDPDVPVPGPWTQTEQLAFIEETLAEHADARWTIVLIHQPLWDYESGPRGDWPRVEALLGDRDYTVFAGHFHRYVRHIRNDRKFITLATTGGGSSLRGDIYGEFDHVAWVTMTAKGPRIANLMLDGIRDDALVTAASRAAVRALSADFSAGGTGRAVRSLPVFGAGPTFNEGVVAFEAANTGEHDMHVAYHVEAGPHLAFADVPRPLVVPPGGRERIEIPLAAIAPMPYADLAPGRIAWSLSTVTAEGPAEVDSTSALLPLTKLPLPSGEPPTLDGNLDDWPELPFKALRQGDVAAPATASTDIAYTFGLREADGDVYFAAAVTDDDVFAAPELSPQVQDGMVLFIDVRPEPDRSANVPLYRASVSGHVSTMAVAYMNLVEAAADSSLDFLADSFAAVDWRAVRTDVGYAVEAKVAGAFLDGQAGEPWREFRLGVAAVDWDAGEIRNRIPWHVRGSSGVALHWQPNRFGDAPVAGTGTFVRADGAARR